MFRVSTQRPTRWSYAPVPHTSRTCWSRIQPSTQSSSSRLACCKLVNLDWIHSPDLVGFSLKNCNFPPLLWSATKSPNWNTSPSIDVNSTGRSLRPPYSYPRVHVCWRGCIIFFWQFEHLHILSGERSSRAIASFPENCWEIEDQGVGWGNSRLWKRVVCYQLSLLPGSWLKLS